MRITEFIVTGNLVQVKSAERGLALPSLGVDVLAKEIAKGILNGDVRTTRRDGEHAFSTGSNGFNLTGRVKIAVPEAE